MEWEVNALVGILFLPPPPSPCQNTDFFCFQEHLLRPFWLFSWLGSLYGNWPAGLGAGWLPGGCCAAALGGEHKSLGTRSLCRTGTTPSFAGNFTHLGFLTVSAIPVAFLGPEWECCPLNTSERAFGFAGPGQIPLLTAQWQSVLLSSEIVSRGSR